MSYDLVKEDVPQFVRRVGDRVMEGSNNSIIILGTDRINDLSSGFGHVNSENSGKDAGSIHLIAGREGQDPNFDSDRAYMYLSMKTNADNNMNTSNIPNKHGVNTNNVSAAMIKADAMRIVCRENIKFVVGNSSILITKDEIVIDSPSLRYGANSKLNEMERSELIKNAILNVKYTTPAGPTTGFIPDENMLKIQQNFTLTKH